jgi:large subunit ribosomal protein L17
VEKVFDDLAKRWPDRTSGYLRITHLARRVGDSAPLMLLELLPSVEEKKTEAEAEAAPRRRRLALPGRRAKAAATDKAPAEKTESAPAKARRAPARKKTPAGVKEA